MLPGSLSIDSRCAACDWLLADLSQGEDPLDGVAHGGGVGARQGALQLQLLQELQAVGGAIPAAVRQTCNTPSGGGLVRRLTHTATHAFVCVCVPGSAWSVRAVCNIIVSVFSVCVCVCASWCAWSIRLCVIVIRMCVCVCLCVS